MSMRLHGRPFSVKAGTEKPRAPCYLRVGWKRVTVSDVSAVVGQRGAKVTKKGARKAMKNFCSDAELKTMMDVKGGYSSARMRELLVARARYLLERGSTLSNRKITKSKLMGVAAPLPVAPPLAARTLRKLIRGDLRKRGLL